MPDFLNEGWGYISCKNSHSRAGYFLGFWTQKWWVRKDTLMLKIHKVHITEDWFDCFLENLVYWVDTLTTFYSDSHVPPFLLLLLFSFYFTSVLTIRVYIADGVNFFHIILLVSMFQLRKHPGYLWPAKQRLTITFSLISRAMVKVSLNWINRYTAQVPTVCNLDSTT